MSSGGFGGVDTSIYNKPPLPGPMGGASDMMGVLNAVTQNQVMQTGITSQKLDIAHKQLQYTQEQLQGVLALPAEKRYGAAIDVIKKLRAKGILSAEAALNESQQLDAKDPVKTTNYILSQTAALDGPLAVFNYRKALKDAGVSGDMGNLGGMGSMGADQGGPPVAPAGVPTGAPPDGGPPPANPFDTAGTPINGAGGVPATGGAPNAFGIGPAADMAPSAAQTDQAGGILDASQAALEAPPDASVGPVAPIQPAEAPSAPAAPQAAPGDPAWMTPPANDVASLPLAAGGVSTAQMELNKGQASAAAADSRGQGDALNKEATRSRVRLGNLQRAKADVKGAELGPKAGTITYIQSLYNELLSQMPKDAADKLGLKPVNVDGVATTENIRKLFSLMAGMQYGGTEAQLALGELSNPNLDLSKLGNKQIIEMLAGTEKYVQAKNRMWNAWRDKHDKLRANFSDFDQKFNDNVDPLAFQFMEMDGKEKGSFLDALPPDERVRVLRNVDQLHANPYAKMGG